MRLVAIILTLNEEKHLARCIASLQGIATEVVVADCFSTDATPEIACAHGAKVIQRRWVNYATQFNWALAQLDTDTDWVLRIDADEILTPELVAEIRAQLADVPANIDGIVFVRRMTYQGRLICHGGIFPIRVLRLFRYGRGECENRWMDEHIKVKGLTTEFRGELIDDNLNSLTWWIEKHNKYASREAVDLLNIKYRFMVSDTVATFEPSDQAGFKRWIKEKVYTRLPLGLRGFAYFFYRYFLRAGFLDGRAGLEFHFLQGLWYRFLVDAKIREVERYIANEKVNVTHAIEAVLGIRVVER